MSSNNYLDLKRNFDIPIYDILTPTIDYLNQSNLSNIGVIATEMTIKSGIFNNVNKPVIQIYCPKFVPLIENNMIDTIEMENAINEYLEGKIIDNLVLGCTHYPLIKSKIKEVLKRDITFIDMGEILTNSLILENNNYKLNFYFSRLNDNIKNKLATMFEDYEIEEVEL